MPTEVVVGEPAIVAIDPGLTTGFAVYRHAGLPTPVNANIAAGQIEGRFAFYDAFDALVAWGLPLVVVMERFTITGATAQKSPQLDPLYIIGAVERQANKLGFPFVFQTPSKAMSFATDDKLKAVGWYQPGKGHANDALRHLLTFVLGQKQPGAQSLFDQLVDRLDIA